MTSAHDDAPGGGPGAASKDQVGTGSAPIVGQTGDIPATPIRCRYANRSGYVAACGAFDAEHHTRAAEAGLCCVDLAFREVGHDHDQAVNAPAGADWPPFDPRDEDVPGGDGW